MIHFSDLGVANAVIRRPPFSQHNLQTALTLKILLSVGAFGAAFLIAPFARHFFDHPATANVIRVLALTFLVSTAGFLPTDHADPRNELSGIDITRSRRRGLSVHSGDCVSPKRMELLGGYHRQRRRHAYERCCVAIYKEDTFPSSVSTGWTPEDSSRFGIPLFGSGMLAFVIFNLDNFLVGASMGSAKLGYYALAFTWGSFVCRFLQQQ